MPKFNRATTEKLRIMTCNLTEDAVKLIDKLVEFGLVASRSEYLRQSLNRTLKEDLMYVEKVKKELEDFDPSKFIRIPNGDGTYQDRKLIRRLE